MTRRREFRGPMEKTSESGANDASVTRVKVQRRRLLLAHDAKAHTCDRLAESIADAFADVELVDASSVDDAYVALRRSRFDACLVCLDLPPAPSGGVKLAQAALRERERAGAGDTRTPVVLVTRSLRWLPARATELRSLPWITPDADAADVARAIEEAIASGRSVPAPPISDIVLARGGTDHAVDTEGEASTSDSTRTTRSAS